MSLPKTISQVVDRLELILNQQLQQNKYACLFTYIYMITTLAVKKGIEDEIFDDNQRMELFDVRFANLYIKAYEDKNVGKPISASWQRVFEFENDRLTIIQHILLGMNAHINLDLCIAAAETCEGESIHDLETDFQQINNILFGLTKQAQNKIGSVSPLFFLLDNFISTTDEEIINFSMKQARNQSWRNAVLLANTNEMMWPILVAQIDQTVASLGKRIAKPKSFFFRKVLQVVANTEEKNLQTILTKIYE